jgi:NitT/TauT family transport system ATP-binding protein
MAPAYLEIRDVAMSYGDGAGAVKALESIDLAIREHEFVTIVGPSGCGKSTLLYLVGGFLRPTAGSLRLRDRPIAGPDPDRGIVFQRYSLFPHLTVLENVLLGLEFAASPLLGRLFGGRRRKAVDSAKALLESLGLAASQDRYPAQLSGGMQQRLSIAQSVIRQPKILLLDEPFGALDPGITADLHKLILDQWSTNRMTILMITHDIKESFQLGTRLLVFDKVRHDPQAPEAYGARVTYDLRLRSPAAHLIAAAA